MACGAAVGCVDDEQGGPAGEVDDGFDRAGLLSTLASDVVLTELKAAASTAETLTAAVKADCAAAAPSPTSTAQPAWRDAMVQWSRVEAMRIGPLADDSGRRDAVYAWPVTNACAVDQGVAALLADPSGFDISGQLTNRRGLDALEWLVFAPDTETKCPPQVPLDAYTALDEDGRRAARCEYATLAAADLQASIDALVLAMQPASEGGGGGVDDFANAGQEGSPFATRREALNHMSDALFHLEKVLKDTKLSRLGGFGENSCDVVSAPCPEDAETPWARIDLQLIGAQLAGFRALFVGTEATGFDDWLAHHGQQALSDEMLADLDAAIAANDALGGDLDGTLSLNYAGFVEVYDHTRAVGVNLKSQFLTTLGLDLPSSAAGDND
jgi:predicted lipoprotein